MTKHCDTLIVGGGVSGLSTAWWLAQRGIQSVLLESASRSGGLIDSTQDQGYLTEHAASMLLNFNSSVNRFIHSSGLLEHKILRRQLKQRHLFKQDRLVEVPDGMRGLMLSRLFSTKTRLQLMGEIFRPARPAHWESVADFIRRRLGQEILDLAIDPYVSAVLACDPELACAQATLPRLSKLEQQFGSFTAGILLKKLLPGKKGPPQEVFNFDGGMKTLTEVLSQNTGSDIRLNQRVLSVTPLKRGWRVISHDGTHESQFHAAHLVFSTPANVTADLLKPSLPNLSGLLGKIDYAPIAQVHLGIDRCAFKKTPVGGGFLVPGRAASVPIRGSLWMSNLMDKRAPPGKFLASNFFGGACQPDALDKTDNALIDQAVSTLEKLCGLRGTPEMLRVNRHKQGLPLYHGQYHALTQAIDNGSRQTNGLHIVANYLHGVSVRDRIIQAEKVACQIEAALSEVQKPGKFHMPELATG